MEVDHAHVLEYDQSWLSQRSYSSPRGFNDERERHPEPERRTAIKPLERREQDTSIYNSRASSYIHTYLQWADRRKCPTQDKEGHHEMRTKMLRWIAKILKLSNVTIGICEDYTSISAPKDYSESYSNVCNQFVIRKTKIDSYHQKLKVSRKTPKSLDLFAYVTILGNLYMERQ